MICLAIPTVLSGLDLNFERPTRALLRCAKERLEPGQGRVSDAWRTCSPARFSDAWRPVEASTSFKNVSGPDNCAQRLGRRE